MRHISRHDNMRQTGTSNTVMTLATRARALASRCAAEPLFSIAVTWKHSVRVCGIVIECGGVLVLFGWQRRANLVRGGFDGVVCSGYCVLFYDAVLVHLTVN